MKLAPRERRLLAILGLAAALLGGRALLQLARPDAPGSPAAGAGEPAECLETDQRGFPRAASCSAGSYEADAPRCPPDMAPTEDLLD
ncbi:MAG: hypothetical protein K8I65_05255, partial [Thermoanaerobaculia bacterium]|nr:hypothetical protein [Thermoanaerobaculia bacterium]